MVALSSSHLLNASNQIPVLQVLFDYTGVDNLLKYRIVVQMLKMPNLALRHSSYY